MERSNERGRRALGRQRGRHRHEDVDVEDDRQGRSAGAALGSDGACFFDGDCQRLVLAQRRSFPQAVEDRGKREALPRQLDALGLGPAGTRRLTPNDIGKVVMQHDADRLGTHDIIVPRKVPLTCGYSLWSWGESNPRPSGGHRPCYDHSRPRG